MSKAWTELPPAFSKGGEPIRRFMFGVIPKLGSPASLDAQHIYLEASFTWPADELADDLSILGIAIEDGEFPSPIGETPCGQGEEIEVKRRARAETRNPVT